MRSELGLSGETHQAVRVRSRQAPRDGLNETTAVYDEEVQLHDLKVRARRRLIGALVLLGAAFVILPWVFDGQRKQTAAEVAVAIPDKNIQFDVKNPKATDESLKAAAESAEKTATAATDSKSAAPATSANSAASKPSAEVKAEAKPETKPEAKPETAPATTTASPQYAVHIGLVSDKKELDALLAKLRAAGVQPQLRTVTVDGVNKGIPVPKLSVLDSLKLSPKILQRVKSMQTCSKNIFLAYNCHFTKPCQVNAMISIIENG